MMATDTAAIVIVDTIGDVITTGTIIVMTAVSMIAVMTGVVTAIAIVMMMTATTIDALWSSTGAGKPGVTVDSRLAAR
nr:hypothetical protein [Pseudomonas sp. D1HM]